MRAQANSHYHQMYRLGTNYEDELRERKGNANKALDLAKDGMNVGEICKKLKISRNTLNKTISVLSEQDQTLYQYYLDGGSTKTPKNSKTQSGHKSVSKDRFMDIVKPYCKDKN